ncbi:MAG: S1 RNA-binding domain-containing protein [Lachnospiraceae bacterium]|nr:S1 RNA-binding domain-containing protein [Lachnospiraceae bacterium]
MIKLGEKQILKIVKQTDFGVYLSAGDEDKVLLPIKQLPQGAELGDEVEVFVYRDSMDRLIATTNKPLAMVGEIANLKVKEVTGIGAFLDWGLERDLLLPYKEQTVPIKAGDSCPVYIYVDKSNRLCATMKIYGKLSADTPYSKDDVVKGVVYDIKKDYGVFVAVDNRYFGLVPPPEVLKRYNIGDEVEGRVLSVRDDGKLNLSLRKKAYEQMDDDADVIWKALIREGGRLGFNDKSDAQKIKETFGMSKNAFKRAVGRLLKEGKIELTGEEIIKK